MTTDQSKTCLTLPVNPTLNSFTLLPVTTVLGVISSTSLFTNINVIQLSLTYAAFSEILTNVNLATS